MHTFVKSRRINATLVATLVAFLCMAGVGGHVSAADPTQNDFQRLEGRWVRPDGGYILELRSIKKDGGVSAAYFNPRSIKVYSAKVSRKEGNVILFVELRDVNYPGSTYSLQYDAATDRLKGTYYQAVQRQNFDIEFVRVR